MPNLFVQLFPFRANENFSPKENFLTEAFAYFLQRDQGVFEAFIEKITEERLDIEPGYKVLTRAVEFSSTGRCYPDLKLVFHAAGKGGWADWTVLSEHKWESPIRQDQLQEYTEVLTRPGLEGKKRLVTIVAQPMQKMGAEEATRRLRQKMAAKDPSRCQNVSATHLLWEDIYNLLIGLPNQEPLFTQFLDFMKSQNLNPGPPIETKTMQAFLASVGFKSQLTRYAEKLLAEYDWSMVPKAYRSKPKVKDCWGRIGLEFMTPGWNPTLSVGFLYDTADHRVAFTAPGESIDVFLRLEAERTVNPDLNPVLPALRDKADKLRKLCPHVLVWGELGNGNRNSLLIAQQSLAAVISGRLEERLQIQAIYETLTGWTACLFQDQSLEPVLSTLKPVSGLNGKTD